MQGRKYIVFGVLLLAVLLLLILPFPVALRIKASVYDNFNPFNRLSSVVKRKFQGLSWYVADAWNAHGARGDLENEIVELKRELWQVKKMVYEDYRLLTEMKEIEEKDNGRLIMCEVLTRGNTSGWWESVRLNRGAAEGVRTNLAVITMRGLVGRTREVSKYSSEVLLITDPASKVSCKLHHSGAFGILQGRGVGITGKRVLEVLYSAEPARMDFIRTDTEYTKGEKVYTSGLGGVYPAGILVGRIKTMVLDDTRLFLIADVVPSAKLSGLRFVFIVVPEVNRGV